MDGTHWTEDELIDRLYGIGREGEPGAHCAECGARWDRLAERRQAALRVDYEVSPERLTAQLRSVEALSQRPKPFRGWMPIAAAACLLAVAFFYERPAQRPPVAAVTDAQLFEDVFAEAERSEPRALMPVQGLFEGKQADQ